MKIQPAAESDVAKALKALGADDVSWLPRPSSKTSGWRKPIVRENPTAAAMADLLKDFDELLTDLGLSFDHSTRVDLLAAYLSCQFVLLAGPSGTGKSTAARLLQDFFATRESTAIVEARRQLIGPEDLVGYYSVLGGRYLGTPDLPGLVAIGSGGPESCSPSLLVEEINLSPVEGYLSPFMHGLSRPATRAVPWTLYSSADFLEGEDGPDIPERLTFEPFLRLIGTINVDATAMSPSPKVTSRACVVLIEPADSVDFARAEDYLKADASGVRPSVARGATFVESPALALESLAGDEDRRNGLKTELEGLVAAVIKGASEQQTIGRLENFVTRRQAAQMLCYVAWFSLLAEGYTIWSSTAVESAPKIAAENALLHFVLPGLPPAEFTAVLNYLTKSSFISNPADPKQLGSILASRVKRLESAAGESFIAGRYLDFWDRLS